ncbi:MAG: hypothetical protein Q7K44_01680 [Candidatus Liptonbacteria bacterium]|nr:hypothetical protein [Candidatus Liptonbacteria bacterium]
MDKLAVSEFDVGPYEAQDEIQRVATEKKLNWLPEALFIFFAFSAAKKCTNEYIKTVNAGGTEIACDCGYHPSRSPLKTLIIRETALEDMRNIAKRFSLAGEDNEATRCANILLQVLDTARNELKQPKFLRVQYLKYLNSATLSKELPELALDVIKYVDAGEITVKQADNALIEIKGRYQTVFAEMGINPTPVPISEK